MLFVHGRYPSARINHSHDYGVLTERGMVGDSFREIEFSNNKFRTDDPSEIDAIRKSADFRAGIIVERPDAQAVPELKGIAKTPKTVNPAPKTSNICSRCNRSLKNARGLEIHQRTCVEDSGELSAATATGTEPSED